MPIVQLVLLGCDGVYIGTADNFIGIEFKLRISDHSVYKDGVTVPVDVDYCAMPTSTALSADCSTWEDMPNVTWNAIDENLFHAFC
jgi:hypothetical protein